MDENNDGKLDKMELLRANQIAGSPLSELEIDEILLFVAEKYEGNFDLETVFKMMLRKQVVS